jgi:hypothetical protein
VPTFRSTNPNQQSGPSPGSGSDTGGKESFQISAPSISLPKGGGAIHGMGEKFAANPLTGNGSMSVPIATSPRPFRVRSAGVTYIRLWRR